MEIQNLLEKYQNHKHTQKVVELSQKKTPENIHLKGLHTSAKAFFIANIIKATKNNQLFILSDKEEAAYFQNDLKEIFKENEILFYPSSYKRSVIKDTESKIDRGSVILRTEVLDKISTEKKYIVVSYPEAVIEKVTSKTVLKENTLVITEGEEVPIDFITEVLEEYFFERVDFVYEPGQFAVRGSIVDIFSFSNDYPYRIDFFDEEVETIRTFDTVSQLSKERFKKISIIPDIQNNTEETQKISFFDFISENTLIWSDNFKLLHNKTTELSYGHENENLIDVKSLKKSLEKSTTLEFSNKAYFTENQQLKFRITKQKSFNKKFDLFASELYDFKQKEHDNFVLSANNIQIERLKEILNSEEIKLKVIELSKANDFEDIDNLEYFQIVNAIIHKGFIDNDLKINCYTDHQIFGRYHKFQVKSSSYHKNKEALTINEINALKPGDFVVHIDHGIGKFGGLQTVNTNGKQQEAIRLFYKNNDILLVNIHNIHKVSKYKGKEGKQPTIYKLGSNAWQKIKSKTKSRVKDIARELISLYAKRKQEKGFAYSPDTYLQHALESSFLYEDTPDQAKACDAVKADMESNIPMDRLVCGDVGFGKTEVAIRAAFKAVADSKQVAILVPTTILALQHYKTFVERLKDLPCNIDYISRMKSRKQQTETLKKLAEGKIDILIGTHRIVSKDIKFKDLGLMIIDEEQKFGVAVKEKLKAFKVNVDTLTLTATPIPRTLQFSLMGARDLSIINTAPPNRYPIITELHTFDKKIIKDALTYEIQRNGQVFFIHNRIDTIYSIESMINKLIPNVRTAIIHGRMRGEEAEAVMSSFIKEETTILIATSIIESGLDIPNANTIIINNAQNFGLSDLHQLRGRVGRSNKKAFCYLFSPPLHQLPVEGRQRLQAIENFSELGSGFNIAMQDLDIRGAGNMLGGEQSGFIADIGFETYHRILDEAVLELKEEEFKQLFTQKSAENSNIEDEIKFLTDCHIDTDLEILLPPKYVENSTERLKLYRELDKINEEKSLIQFEEELKDRFGKLPKPTKELIDAVRLRKLAISLGIEKILLRNNKLVCYFISNQESMFYQSKAFGDILAFVGKFPKKVNFKEYKQRLTMSFQDIDSIKTAITILNMIR